MVLTPEQEALFQALRPKPEPDAHCYDCPNRFGECAEYTALNPGWIKMGLGEYDREHCRWGAESIKKEKEEKAIDSKQKRKTQ